MTIEKGTWPVAPDLKDTRREAIRNEAARLFAIHGYRSTTLDDIATSLNVTKGAIYYYFKSKDEILHAIVLVAMEAMESNFNSAVALQKDVVSTLYDILYGHVLAVLANRNSLGVYLRERTEMNEADRAPIDSRMRAYMNSVAGLVSELPNANHLVVDPQIVVLSWFASCNSVIQWYRPEGLLPSETIADILAGMAIRSIGFNP